MGIDIVNDVTAKTIDEVIAKMQDGYALRVHLGSLKYAYLIKFEYKEKSVAFVTLEMVDEMFAKDLLVLKKQTPLYKYYELKENNG